MSKLEPDYKYFKVTGCHVSVITTQFCQSILYVIIDDTEIKDNTQMKNGAIF
jgi:hypothetical protein